MSICCGRRVSVADKVNCILTWGRRLRWPRLQWWRRRQQWLIPRWGAADHAMTFARHLWGSKRKSGLLGGLLTYIYNTLAGKYFPISKYNHAPAFFRLHQAQCEQCFGLLNDIYDVEKNWSWYLVWLPVDFHQIISQFLNKDFSLLE